MRAPLQEIVAGAVEEELDVTGADADAVEDAGEVWVEVAVGAAEKILAGAGEVILEVGVGAGAADEDEDVVEVAGEVQAVVEVGAAEKILAGAGEVDITGDLTGALAIVVIGRSLTPCEHPARAGHISISASASTAAS
jgi:acyl-CoA hydrolase